jgi:Glycosyltransferase family 87
VTPGQPLGAKRLAQLAGYVAMGAAIGAAAVTLAIGAVGFSHTWLIDFHGDLWVALRDILHGHDPYRPGLVAHEAALKNGQPYVVPTKPPSILLLFLPFGLLPVLAGGLLFIAFSAAGIVVALRLLGVRDWRCYALAFAAYPVITGLSDGNASPLLLLGAAVMWRWRERLWSPALALAGMVLLKIFPWVLGAWFVIRRRWRALALSVVVALVTTGLAWAVIGFASMLQYPKMLVQFAQSFHGTGPSLTSLLFWMGVSMSVAQLISLAVAGMLVAAAWRLVGRAADEGRAFGLVVVASLIAAPYIWDHYTVLLFVPIALCSRSFSWVWLLPVLPDFFREHLVDTPHNIAYLGFWIAIQAAVTLRVLWPPSARGAMIAPSLAAQTPSTQTAA